MSTQYFRFAARRSLEPHRCAPLEQLLARSPPPAAVVDWRADAFRVIALEAANSPGLSAVALTAACGPVPGAWVFFASPVHYLAEMSNVRLAADGVLTLQVGEADTLAADFNRVWHDAGIRLAAAAAGRLFCILDLPLEATTQDPADVLNQHIENHLATGSDAARLRQLMSEIEMWLFEHAVNRRRAGDGLPAVSGLWLWGGGPVLAALPQITGWTAGNDPFFAALSSAGAEWGGANSAVIIIAAEPGSSDWQGIESQWLRPAIEQLRSGALARIELSAGDRCFQVTARGSRRFWQRLRPWWEYFP